MTPVKSLRQKTTSAMFWKAVETFAGQIIAFVVGIIVARILMPSDYGLVGMLAIFITISDIFVSGGFSAALIQRQSRSDVDYSTVFFFNLFVGIFFYFILYLSAPYIAKFYNEPTLIPLTRILTLNIIINSLSIVQQARLTLNLDFKTQAKISILSTVISGTIGISAAYKGFGVWAIVLQRLTSATIKTILLYYFNAWFPKLIFSIESFKKLFSFGSKLYSKYCFATSHWSLWLFGFRAIISPTFGLPASLSANDIETASDNFSPFS